MGEDAQQGPREMRHRTSTGTSVDVRTIRILEAIGKSGSISGAARLLDCSQPSITKHLQRTEARIAVPLVHRSTRYATLTEAGRSLANLSQQIIQPLVYADELLEGMRRERAGRVSIASYPTGSTILVPALFSQLQKLVPDLELSAVSTGSEEALRLLMAGSSDVAIIDHPRGTAPDQPWIEHNQLDIHDLFLDPVLVAVAAGHPLAAAHRLGTADLADSAWVGRGVEDDDPLTGVSATLGFDPVIRFRTDNPMASLRLVRESGLLTLVTSLDVVAFGVPANVTLIPLPTRFARTVSVAVPAWLRESPQLATIIGILQSLEDLVGAGAARARAASRIDHPFQPPGMTSV